MIVFTPRLLRDLLEALRFLTPFSLPGATGNRNPASVIHAFPLAGLALGLVLVLVDALLDWMALPLPTRDALLVALLVLLTGGLHLDGLMDTCDGLFGGHSPEQRLAIMRDSRVGSFGVLGGFCVLLLKVGLLGAFPGAGRVEALFIMPMLGRWSMALAAVLFPSARPDGLGASFHAGATVPGLARAFLTCVLVTLAVGRGSLVALAASCCCVWLVGRLFVARIGGLTGDSYGAVCELNEVLALFMLALAVGGT